MLSKRNTEIGIALLCLMVSGLLAWGAIDIPGEAGYQGVGPNFLPWVVCIALAACGATLLYQALSGGFRARGEVEGAAQGDLWPFVWISAALLLNALLMTRIGFIASCTLCFVIAVRGFHLSQGRRDFSAARLGRDALIGIALCAPVFWLFTKVLGVSLPALTSTGWL